MTEVTAVMETLERSLAEVEPPAFRQRLQEVLGDVTLTPAILTVRTARALEPALDVEACAPRGVGVQLTYEGLALTRSILRGEPWEATDRSGYYLDLVAAALLVSRGYRYLAEAGVAEDAVEVARRFGRHQTYLQNGNADMTYSLEADFVSLAVNTGADIALGTIPPSLTAYGESLGREIGTEPFSAPDDALVGVEERVATLVSAPELTGVDEYDE